MVSNNLPLDRLNIDDLDEEEMDLSNCCGGDNLMGHCSICGEGFVSNREEMEYQLENQEE